MVGGRMTLFHLARIRTMGAKPAYPVVLTNERDVWDFCKTNDLPVIWETELGDDADLRPLHGLDVWVIGIDRITRDRIKEHRPAELFACGRFGFQHRINTAVGRMVIEWN